MNKGNVNLIVTCTRRKIAALKKPTVWAVFQELFIPVWPSA